MWWSEMVEAARSLARWPGFSAALTLALGIPLVLAAVAVTASWLPALRASRVHPSEALRSE